MPGPMAAHKQAPQSIGSSSIPVYTTPPASGAPTMKRFRANYRACYFGCSKGFQSQFRFSWYRSSYETDFDNSEIASPELRGNLRRG